MAVREPRVLSDPRIDTDSSGYVYVLHNVTSGGGGGSGIWASHPSAIGYRPQGYTTGGSHGGSGTITIAAVAPEFDSGMNSGADQDEMERLLNFGQGAEENPTVAQSQPISRRSSGSAESRRGPAVRRWTA